MEIERGAKLANQKPEITKDDLQELVEAGRMHERLMVSAIKSHGYKSVTNWVIKALSIHEYGLPHDPTQKAHKIKTWADEVGVYPVWALVKVAAWLKVLPKAPTLREALDDLELASGTYRRRHEALLKAYRELKDL